MHVFFVSLMFLRCQLLCFPGITGGSGLLFAQAFAYLSDVTSNENRLLRIIVLMSARGITQGATNLGVGYIIRDYGFGPCLWLMAASFFAAFMYVVIPCFLIETVDRKGEAIKKQNKESGKEKSMFARVRDDLLSLFKINTNMRRWRLGLLFVIDFMRELLESSSPLVIIYGLGPPFCWTSVQVSGYWMIIFLGGSIGKTQMICYCY